MHERCEKGGEEKMTSANELLQEGIEAAKENRVGEALALLKQVVELEPRNEMAWLWLSDVVGTNQQRIICLENVLAINPDNQPAQEGLSILRRRAATIKPLPEGVEEPARPMTTATAVSPKRTTKPHQRTPAPRPWRTQHKSSGKAIRLIGVIGLLLIVAVAIGVWVDVSGSRTRTTPRTPTPARHARWGGDGVLRSTGGGPLPVAVDRDAYEEFNTAVPRDKYGVQELLLSGRVFSVEDGTEVLVIETGGFSYRIRILEGAHAGRDGWVAYEFVDFY